jgi:LuxR family maltose regulon positive regulatory protein
VIAALQTIAPAFGETSLKALHSPQPPPAESVLIALVNEVSELPGPLLLVLDDYHAIDSTAVDNAVTFLLEHLPPQLHVVISTRQDPNLPIARLRGRGQLIEVRASDLRFTPEEAAEYLNSVMGLALSASDIAALERRTEGWIAGLQLAALSIRGHVDASAFISAFAGDDRYVADYLVGEVLGRQPDDVRSFLLQTAVLDRMNGPLCDAVIGQENSNARLEALERGNFFVVPLDDKRHWYRYHHLFAEVLRAYLAEEQPDALFALHRRASAWYERNGSPPDAIRRSLAAEDFEHAAELVELAAPDMHRSRQEVTLLAWLRALPEDMFDHRPVLNAMYAGTLLSNGVLDGVEDRLRHAERCLDASDAAAGLPTPSAAMAVVNKVELRRMPAQIAVWRAGIAQLLGRTDETVRHARRALELVGEDDDGLVRGAASALIGLAAWAGGDLESAYEMYAAAISRLHRVGNVADVIGCSITLADIRITQGRLREAMAIYRRGLELATGQGGPILRGAADMLVGMSELHRQLGDLGAARRQLVRSEELGDAAGLPQNPYRRRVAMAGIREAHAELDGAVELLDEAERVFTSDFSPDVRPIAAMRARIWIQQGKLDAARAWAHDHGLSTRGDLSYVREYEHLTLARLLVAEYMSERQEPSGREAMQLLERLLYAAQEGGRTANVIEVLVQQALAHQASGNSNAALASLERALTLAEPEGYVRIFVGEGEPIFALLEAVAKRGTASRYARQLLNAVDSGADMTQVKQPLVDPLSERELEVLRLLRTDLDGPEIARKLIVSLNTMRSHTKNIYSKLGVNNRRAAVRRAEELDLLPRTS